jgi:hypothetical protein
VGGGASIIAANKASKATSKASQAATETTLQASRENNALQREIYDKNSATLSPFVATGRAAGDALNGFLGLNPSSQPGGGDFGSYVRSNPDVFADWQQNYANTDSPLADISQFGKYHYDAYGKAEGRPFGTPGTTPAGAGGTGLSAIETFLAPSGNFADYRNATGYDFRLNEGQKSIGAVLGSRGMLDSGAAVKAALKYGQDYGSNEYNNFTNQQSTQFNQRFSTLTTYLDALRGQQNTGLTAASSQAGVGQGFANAVGGNTTSAATIAANAAIAAGNAKGNAALGTAGAVNGVLGNALSAYTFNQGLGSSYGGGSDPTYGGLIPRWN